MSIDSCVLPAHSSSPNGSDSDELETTARRTESAAWANHTTKVLHFKVNLPPFSMGTVGTKTVFPYGKPD